MTYSIALTVPAGTVASTLTSFVTRVDLSHMTAGWWADTTSDLGNVRVKQAGSTIPFDVVWYDRTAKTGELFFKATLTTSDNAFTVETVNGATALPATDTNGRNAVWSDYSCMLHSAALINRNGGASPSASGGSVATSTTGLLTFNGSTDRLTFTVTKPTSWTMGFSGAPSSIAPGSTAALHINTEATTGNADRETLGTRDQTPDQWGLWNTTDSWLSGSGGVTTSRIRINATHDGTTERKVWKSGTLFLTDTGCAAKPSGTGTAFQVGGRNGDAGAERWDGTLGYAYLRPSVLSAAWLAAENASWETPASFYTIVDATGGSFGATLPVVTASFTGFVQHSGALAATLPKVTADLTGFVRIDGDMAATLPSVTASLTGSVRITGQMNATARRVAASFTGTSPAIGTLAAVFPPLTAELTGLAQIVGTFDATIPQVSTAITGTNTPPPNETDVSNPWTGRSRSMVADVTIITPVAPTPPGTVLAPRVDKAVALPAPDMDNGRPT